MPLHVTLVYLFKVIVYGNIEAEIAEVKRFSGKFTMFKYYGAMHKLLVGECLTGAKSVR